MDARHGPVLFAALALLLVAGSAQADTGGAPGFIDRAQTEAQEILADPVGAVQDPGGTLMEVLQTVDGSRGSGEGVPAPPAEGDGPSFGDRVRGAFESDLVLAGSASIAAVLAGLGAFAFVTRYISPKEALKNPQRAMLYGFIRGNPGIHLKQLSEEFKMKTSSILWHLRKLEAAELVHSERANGYRVFYPVAGGMEVKRVSRAITALQNDNAHRIFTRLLHNPGATSRRLAEQLGIHSGTVRWHMRKLRDFGLVEELVRDDGSRFYATPLGERALETMEGSPVTRPSRPSGAPVPEPM